MSLYDDWAKLWERGVPRPEGLESHDKGSIRSPEYYWTVPCEHVRAVLQEPYVRDLIHMAALRWLLERGYTITHDHERYWISSGRHSVDDPDLDAALRAACLAELESKP